MASSEVFLPCRVLLLQILLSSLLFLLSCQELRASTLPDRRISAPDWTCGLEDTVREHTVDEHSTIRTEAPWKAALFKRNISHPRDLNYFCGGVLVTKRHVISAAHCFYDEDFSLILPNIIQVRLGKYDLSKQDEVTQQSFTVDRITPHESYSHVYRSDHDIAVLLLDREVSISSYVRPVCLWNQAATVTDCNGTVVGWGSDLDNMVTNLPFTAKVPVIMTQECRDSHIEFREHYVTAYTYCAGSPGTHSPCSGDSGSGMYFPTRDSEGDTVWMVRGLVSRGINHANGTCDVTRYVTFTDLIMLAPWLHQQVNLTDRATNRPGLRYNDNTQWSCTADWVPNPVIRDLAQMTELERVRQLLDSAEQGNVALVQLLVQVGVNLTTRSTEPPARSALHLAALHGHLEVVQELLWAGVSSDVRDEDGDSPLHSAAYTGRVELVNILLEHGAEPNLPGSEQRTALHWAAREGHHAVVDLLLNNSADCEARSVKGYTPLNIAAAYGQTSTVRLFARRGCQVNERSNIGRTPLHAAVWGGHVETVRALVELGAGIDIQDDVRDTPLHLAIDKNSMAAVRALEDLGADLNRKNKVGKTPLDLARERRHIEIATFLESRGATIN